MDDGSPLIEWRMRRRKGITVCGWNYARPMTRNADGVIVLIHPCEICASMRRGDSGTLWSLF